jgi:uncharacterized protein YkwD
MKAKFTSSKAFIILSLIAFVIGGLSLTSTPNIADAATRTVKSKKIVKYFRHKGRIYKYVYYAKPATVNRPVVAKATVNPALAAPTPTASVAPQPVSCPRGTFQSEFLCLINNYRASNGKTPLVYDNNLQIAAQYYVDYMNQNKSALGHFADGNAFTTRCEMNGTTCRGENVAWNFNTSPQALFEAWRSSPGHNANMLGNYTATGLALSGAYASNLFR